MVRTIFNLYVLFILVLVPISGYGQEVWVGGKGDDPSGGSSVAVGVTGSYTLSAGKFVIVGDCKIQVQEECCDGQWSFDVICDRSSSGGWKGPIEEWYEEDLGCIIDLRNIDGASVLVEVVRYRPERRADMRNLRPGDTFFFNGEKWRPVWFVKWSDALMVMIGKGSNEIGIKEGETKEYKG